MIIWKKKLIKCCRCHKDYSFDENLFYHLKKYILVCPNCNLMHKVDVQLLGKEYEGLKKIDKLNLTAIDIGSEAINRATAPSGTGVTMIFKTNPADYSGKLTSFELWFDSTYGNATGVKVGTFSGSGTSYTPRDVVSIGNVTAGSKQTFTGKSCNVVVGDFIGIYYAAGDIEFTLDAGGDGNYYKVGDQFGAGTQTYTAFGGTGFTGLASIYGTGETVGWAHKWNGVTISKLNGAVISKWNGIA